MPVSVTAAAVARQGGAALTADHGNCELMRDPATGGPHTAHHQPGACAAAGWRRHPLTDGRLADVAPTLLALMDPKQPREMTGNC
jgi:2,3-bisphosphoglycerate-independent phosphoglycerate mutase